MDCRGLTAYDCVAFHLWQPPGGLPGEYEWALFLLDSVPDARCRRMDSLD